MRVVLDTAVLVAALRSDAGASRLLLRAALEKHYTLLLSVPLVVEYQAVLTRREHLVAAGMTTVDIEVLLDALVLVSEPVHLAFLWRPTLKDPDDDMVLETAVNGGADLVATFNQRDFAAAGTRFGVRIHAPREALAQIRSSS